MPLPFFAKTVPFSVVPHQVTAHTTESGRSIQQLRETIARLAAIVTARTADKAAIQVEKSTLHGKLVQTTRALRHVVNQHHAHLQRAASESLQVEELTARLAAVDKTLNSL